MISIEIYETDREIAIISRGEGEDLGAWSRLQEALMRGVVGGSSLRIEVKVDVLLSELEVIREIRRLFETQVVFGDNCKRRLQGMSRDRAAREAALTSAPISPEILSAELTSAGFKRGLKAFQLKNLSRIVILPHGADFSVPGAGKTTVALANFAIQRVRGRVGKLLVVAPIAAFSAWKDDSKECFASPPVVHVHLGRDSNIPWNADILLTNYHRLAADYDRIRNWSFANNAHLILDEAHRVKRGRSGIHGSAVLDIAFSAVRRDVLTGTPAPQGAYDLVALMRFLYPGQANQILPQKAFIPANGRQPDVLTQTHEALQRYFVRTCKVDLGLPPTTMTILRCPMGVVQKAIYEALKGQYLGQFQLSDPSRRRFRQLGQIMMYLLEAATNPLLITAGADENDLPGFQHPPIDMQGNEHLSDLLRRYADYETPWKYSEIKKIVAEAKARGEKVLVWSTFVRNIRYLEKFLKEWDPAVVHGGVPPKDGAPASASRVREDELNRFRYDPNCTVLLANPAACGEGVSLHHWCHHAVYLDRTFNAGHFLQSQDRIHRLGLAENTVTKFTILVSEHSIDEFVEARLREKVVALARLMDDPGLVTVSLPIDDEVDADASDADLSGSEGFDNLDANEVLRHLTDSR